jgi:hypothetical protein
MGVTNQTYQSALKYVNDMIGINGNNYKVIHTKILQNMVNSEYGRNSNLFVSYVWEIFNNKFKS